MIICGKYGNNQFRTENVTERTRFSKSRSNDLEDIGQGQRFYDTPSHASDHLYQIWKESIKNYRWYRADTIFKAKAKWPWRYRSRSKAIICNTPSHTSDHLCLIWKESIENCRLFFKVKAKKFQTTCQKLKFPDSEKNVTRDTPSNDSDHLCQI